MSQKLFIPLNYSTTIGSTQTSLSLHHPITTILPSSPSPPHHQHHHNIYCTTTTDSVYCNRPPRNHQYTTTSITPPLELIRLVWRDFEISDSNSVWGGRNMAGIGDLVRCYFLRWRRPKLVGSGRVGGKLYQSNAFNW